MNWRRAAWIGIKVFAGLMVVWLTYAMIVMALQHPVKYAPLLLIGFILLMGILGTLMLGAGNRAASFYYAHDEDSIEVRPQYSVAEARVREGKYAEALIEFDKVLQQYPNDTTGHVRIAEILCRHFQRYDAAARQIRLAMENQTKPDTWVFLSNRLADIQVEHQLDYAGARDTMQQVILKYPGSSYAEKARARVMAINEKQLHANVPQRTRIKLPQDNEEQP
jgi:tetratricopeptide (TPR) repeat protein